MLSLVKAKLCYCIIEEPMQKLTSQFRICSSWRNFNRMDKLILHIIIWWYCIFLLLDITLCSHKNVTHVSESVTSSNKLQVISCTKTIDFSVWWKGGVVYNKSIHIYEYKYRRQSRRSSGRHQNTSIHPSSIVQAQSVYESNDSGLSI